jgi:hypothetical protein
MHPKNQEAQLVSCLQFHCLIRATIFLTHRVYKIASLLLFNVETGLLGCVAV